MRYFPPLLATDCSFESQLIGKVERHAMMISDQYLNKASKLVQAGNKMNILHRLETMRYANKKERKIESTLEPLEQKQKCLIMND